MRMRSHHLAALSLFGRVVFMGFLPLFWAFEVKVTRAQEKGERSQEKVTGGGVEGDGRAGAVREGASPAVRGTQVKVQVLDVRGKLMEGIALPTKSAWVWVDQVERGREQGVERGREQKVGREIEKGQGAGASTPVSKKNSKLEKTMLEAPKRRPILRVWVQLPPKTRLRPEAAELKEAGIELELDPDDSPFGKGGRALGFTIRQPHLVIPVELEFGDRHEVNLVVRVLADRPEFFVDPLCERVGIQAHRRRDSGKHLFSAITCEDRVSEIGLYVLSPDEETTILTTGLGQEEAKGSNWRVFRFRKPKAGEGTGRTLGYLRASREGQDRTEYTEHAIVYSPFIPRSRFRLALGSGLTYSSYREQVTEGKLSDIQVQQLGWTFKADVGYTLIPKVLDLGANTFFTILPLWRTPTAYESARFYGINGRLGYRLPVDLGALEMMILSGWYLWGMWVDDAVNPYGVALMSGPQIFFSVRMAQVGHRSFSGYFKYAPIHYKPGIVFSNYELAMGGSFQLNSPEAKHPISLTLDLSTTSIKLERDLAYRITQATQLSMSSVSLGVTIPLL
jgi:hypothetical protein